MMRAVRAFFACVLLVLVSLPAVSCAGAPGGAGHTEDTAAIKALLGDVYKHYGSTGNAQQPKGLALTSEEAKAMLDPGLLALVQGDSEALHGEAGVVNGSDAFCACQDFSAINHVRLKVDLLSGGKAKASASFVNAGQPTEVRFELTKAGSSWRIFDISSKDAPSLRKLLQDEIGDIKGSDQKG